PKSGVEAGPCGAPPRQPPESRNLLGARHERVSVPPKGTIGINLAADRSVTQNHHNDSRVEAARGGRMAPICESSIFFQKTEFTWTGRGASTERERRCTCSQAFSPRAWTASRARS